MVWKAKNPEGNESSKVRFDIVPYTSGRGLDLGCGMYKTWPHFIGVDSRKQWGPSADLNPADDMALRMNIDIEADCKDLKMFTTNSMDFVFSSHLLEHIENPRKALSEWWRVIKPDGFLILYLPHADFYPNVGEPHANPDHKHDFRPNDTINMMKDIGNSWVLLENEERKEGQEYSFFQVFQKTTDGTHRFELKRDHPNTCCVVRYGGFGDQIQAASILPLLKKEDYHITFMTTRRGYAVLKHDPHIDDWIVQDKDQVPMSDLSEYWNHWETKFDRFICLTESCEATLLCMPHRMYYGWPSTARHLMCDVNYLEMVHEIAGLPHEFNPRFYPTEKEDRRARKFKEKTGKFVLWVCDGSSVHKHWPWADSVIAKIMTDTDYKVVMVGGELSSILEQGWEKEPRVIRKCGKWTIRETISVAHYADIVVGPETGVMNAVCILDMPKIVFLSHSSIENLTKYWKNTYSLFDEKCECRPCHKLIYSWEGCVRNSTEIMLKDRPMIIEGAKCQVGISVDQFWNAFKEATKLEKAA